MKSESYIKNGQSPVRFLFIYFNIHFNVARVHKPKSYASVIMSIPRCKVSPLTAPVARAMT